MAIPDRPGWLERNAALLLAVAGLLLAIGAMQQKVERHDAEILAIRTDKVPERLARIEARLDYLIEQQKQQQRAGGR